MKKIQKGFTLIELLVVISIIGLLSSVVFAAVNNARQKGTVAAGLTFDGHTYGAFGAEAVGVWNFEEGGSSNTTADSSGNNYTLNIPVGVSWISSSVSKQALNFSGSSAISKTGFRTFGTNYDLSIKGSFSFWMYSLSSLSGQGVLGIGNGPYTLYLQVSASSGCTAGALALRIWANSTWTNTCFSYNISEAKNKWTHVLVSWDTTTSNDYRAYVDGKQVPTLVSAASFSTIFPTSNNATLYIGGDPTRYFTGYLDNIRIYSQSLQTAQVQQLYTEGLPRHQLTANVE